MSTEDRLRWDRKYDGRIAESNANPDEWLVEALQHIASDVNSFQHPPRALDIACGLGHNAIWLARQGWLVDGVDISPVGLHLARQSAAAQRSVVTWIEADLDDWKPAEAQYDLMIVFRFLHRRSLPRLAMTAIRPGGWLVFETFARAQCDRPDNHLNNPAFTLAEGETETLFPGFEILKQYQATLVDRTVERLLARRSLS